MNMYGIYLFSVLRTGMHVLLENAIPSTHHTEKVSWLLEASASWMETPLLWSREAVTHAFQEHLASSLHSPMEDQQPWENHGAMAEQKQVTTPNQNTSVLVTRGHGPPLLMHHDVTNDNCRCSVVRSLSLAPPEEANCRWNGPWWPSKNDSIQI